MTIYHKKQFMNENKMLIKDEKCESSSLFIAKSKWSDILFTSQIYHKTPVRRKTHYYRAVTCISLD